MIIAAYCTLFALSILLPIGYFKLLRDAHREIWLLILFVSICVVDAGYLLLALSKTVEVALIANKIAYLGQISVMTCMLMLILRLCGFVCPKCITHIAIIIDSVVFGIILTTGHLDWYYKSVTLTTMNGASRLVKEYGILHPFYLVFVLAYFVAMIIAVCISFKKAKDDAQYKLTWLMLSAVMGNIVMWIVEKLVPLNFEFLSVSYFMCELMFLLIYVIRQDYSALASLKASADVSKERTSVIFVESEGHAERLQQILSKLPESTVLSQRQMDMLEGILDGKSRKEIAVDLHLSENTVKMHTSALYKALGVSGREEIYAFIMSKTDVE